MNEAGDIQGCCGSNFLAFALRLRKTLKNLNQEIQPDRESNPDPLRAESDKDSIMSAFLNSTQSIIHEAYNYYLWTLSLADDRTRGWPLVDSPMPTILYTIVYLAIVWAGPRFMKNRRPYKLTWALIPYNLSMAVLNFYIASEEPGGSLPPSHKPAIGPYPEQD
ncbi:hypothetical protein ANN_02329 [Periplaneta americana]|uniref:Elongation of very long chain fatty acids protein n=1 Tax=Periplaneta americana TaxID=6978 RepID=A0ABQ8TVZ4_PERAM|nr:hypothetical protein ANN_02329 [Periplaneta americana]